MSNILNGNLVGAVGAVSEGLEFGVVTCMSRGWKGAMGRAHWGGCVTSGLKLPLQVSSLCL